MASQPWRPPGWQWLLEADEGRQRRHEDKDILALEHFGEPSLIFEIALLDNDASGECACSLGSLDRGNGVDAMREECFESRLAKLAAGAKDHDLSVPRGAISC